jgi:hypothetical protein
MAVCRNVLPALACLLWPLGSQAQESVTVNLASAANWTARASDQARAAVRRVGLDSDPALCLDFDFEGTAGYAMAHADLLLDFPGEYELSLSVKGEAATNDLQVKWIDQSAENVWWYRRPDFPFAREWQTLKIRRRQIEVALGPDRDAVLHHAAALELVVAAGHGGGRGTVCFGQLQLQARAPSPAGRAPLRVSATSGVVPASLPDDKPGPLRMSWRSEPSAGPEQALTVDLGHAREFGGLMLRWSAGARAVRYEIQLSEDGQHWSTARELLEAGGDEQMVRLPDAQARWIRLLLHQGASDSYGLESIELADPSFADSPTEFIKQVAQRAPRGRYPRGFSGEQPYWTLIGVDGGHDSALVSEDGAIEVGAGGYTLEPFLVTDDRLLTWADVRTSQSLADGYLPIPSVRWQHGELALEVTAFVAGVRHRSRLIARYRVGNHASRQQQVRFALALRPLQVNPPTQFLTTQGGAHPIRSLRWDGRVLSVDAEHPLRPLQAPDAFVAGAFEAGPITDRIVAAHPVTVAGVDDPQGLASGAFVYQLDLPAHAVREIDMVIALEGASLPVSELAGEAWIERSLMAATDDWRDKLNRVVLRLPAQGQPIADTLRSSLAYILMSRDGPALRPGTRSYARSWIRDGAMMTRALVQLGHAAAATDFVRWYAGYQFSSGKVPCCVDTRGPDAEPENDSPGELIHAIAELYRFTGDLALLRELWPHVSAGIGYLDALSASEREPVNRAADRTALYGLLPASISHEGYFAKPMHSYWDDFWALRGYKDAVELAQALGDSQSARALAQSRDRFHGDLERSIRLSLARHRIEYIPGAAELGDFDATSTTIALDPVWDSPDLPQGALSATFDRYWDEFVARRDGRRNWEDYTPYELRVVGAFVRLGQPMRAIELLDFFMADRRPLAWNQWAEVVGRDPRKPRFIGDMPHAWVASDYVRSALDLFAYEDDPNQALVLAAGVPSSWFEAEGVQVEGLRTRHGVLSYTLRRRAGRIELNIDRSIRVPPGGLVLPMPDSKASGPALVNGEPVAWDGSVLRVRSLRSTDRRSRLNP